MEPCMTLVLIWSKVNDIVPCPRNPGDLVLNLNADWLADISSGNLNSAIVSKPGHSAFWPHRSMIPLGDSFQVWSCVFELADENLSTYCTYSMLFMLILNQDEPGQG